MPDARVRLVSLSEGLARYRRPLMGAAILWVFLYHVPVEVPRSLPCLPLLALQNIGYAGVDIFLFLSGIGLVYSAGKGSWKRFYCRRFARILPAFWGIALLDVLLFTHAYETPASLFLRFSTLGFWLNRSGYEWFVPTIVALYLIFPAIYWLVGRARQRWIVPTGLSILALAACWWAADHANHLVISLSRFPIFFIGIHMGMALSTAGSAKPLPEPTVRPAVRPRLRLIAGGVALAIGGALLLGAFLLLEPVVLWRSGWFWYPFIAATVPLVWLILQLLHLVESHLWRPLMRLLMATLGFFGTITLEFYLAHDLVIKKGPECGWFVSFLERFPQASEGVFNAGIILVISVLLACVLYSTTRTTQCLLRIPVRKQPS